MTSLMVQGVSSGAGKSLVVAGLCRSLARRGIRVAPFKAQNMSNNARVVDGGEIGTAQWLQALAAGITPDVRMNPVLLKPESDTRSQVVVNGQVSRELTGAPWRGRSKQLWPAVVDAYESLRDDYDVVLLEGAGSPAETNLWPDDIVNMAMADHAEASVLLVADIDRGGAFAHLYGTWSLLPPHWQKRIEGFLLNKFRGDASLLAPAPTDLEARTGVPTVGVLPWVDHDLPDEEGPTRRSRPRTGPRVALVCGPYASNLDEFAALQQVADVRLVGDHGTLADADLVILPGSKHAVRDLAWLRATGLADQVLSAATGGVPVLGICGGLQMLGERIDDPHSVEGAAGGLDLLPIVTTYEPDKLTTGTTARFDTLPAPWTWLSGRELTGYEIRHGHSEPRHGVVAACASPTGLAFARGNVLGVYLHGLFEGSEVLKAFTGSEPEPLDAAFDQLADALDVHLDQGWLEERVG